MSCHNETGERSSSVEVEASIPLSPTCAEQAAEVEPRVRE